LEVIGCAAVVDAAILNAMLLPIDVSFVQEVKLPVHDDLACPKHDLSYQIRAHGWPWKGSLGFTLKVDGYCT